MTRLTSTTKPALPQPLGRVRSLPTYGSSRPSDAPVLFRLSSNENPYPTPEPIRRAIAEAAARTCTYPPLHPAELISAIALHLGVTSNSVAVGGGSVAVLEQIIRAYVGIGDEVVYAWRSYEAYPIIVGAAGGTPIEVPLIEHRTDLDAVLAAITPNTKVVIICNPNNPTGTTVSSARLDRFLDQVAPHCLVVIDEAYREFRSDSEPDGITLSRGRSNVAVLRTFSKAYGLAGLRIGYAIAPPEIIDSIQRIALPFGASSPAVAGALAALRATDDINTQVRALTSERDRMTEIIRSAGLPVVDSQANFLWLPLSDASEDLAERCASGGVAVRCFPAEGVRITVGIPAATEKLSSLFAQHENP